jgi:hypothetical protein
MMWTKNSLMILGNRLQIFYKKNIVSNVILSEAKNLSFKQLEFLDGLRMTKILF